MYVCMCVYIYMCVSVCVCVYMYVCACVSVCVYICACSITCLYIHYLHTIPFISYSIVFIAVFNLVLACSALTQ